jgi:hypothetical protein
MPILAKAKLRAVTAIGSRPLRADAMETLTCGYLAWVLLGGLLANAVFHWWWLDAAGALAIVPLLLREAKRRYRAESAAATVLRVPRSNKHRLANPCPQRRPCDADVHVALFFPFAVAALLMAGCRGKTSDGAASTAPLLVWEPDAKLLDDLEPITAVDAYEVRPPKGYLLNPPDPNASQGMRAFYWKGTPREDNSYAHFMIVLKSEPAGEAKERSLEKELDELLEGFKRRRSNWTQTSPERGQVNGLTFVRTYWSGIDPARQGKLHGFMYAAKEGSTLITLSSQDVELHHERALKLAEAAALTFKKK